MKKQLLLAEKGEWDPFKLKITKVSEEFYVITTTKYLWETTKKFSNTSFITFLDGAKEGLVKEKNNRTLQIIGNVMAAIVSNVKSLQQKINTDTGN